MAAILASCSTAATQPDQLCPEIAAFANATQGESAHAVALTTDWGGRFIAGPGSMFAQNCDHPGYPPGAALCHYLVRNTSTEFAILNFNRAFACISGARTFPLKTVTLARLDTLLWVYDVPAVKKNVRVTLEFSSGTKTAPPVLKIMAEGFAPRENKQLDPGRAYESV